jgi:hypothetical protein
MKRHEELERDLRAQGKYRGCGGLATADPGLQRRAGFAETRRVYSGAPGLQRRAGDAH